MVLGTSVTLKKGSFSSLIGSWGCAVCIRKGSALLPQREGAASLETVMALLAVSVGKEMGP